MNEGQYNNNLLLEKFITTYIPNSKHCSISVLKYTCLLSTFASSNILLKLNQIIIPDKPEYD